MSFCSRSAARTLLYSAASYEIASRRALSKIHLTFRTHVVAILDQGAVPDCHFCREFVEVAHMGFQFGRPPVDDLFDAFPFVHGRWRDGKGRGGGCS